MESGQIFCTKSSNEDSKQRIESSLNRANAARKNVLLAIYGFTKLELKKTVKYAAMNIRIENVSDIDRLRNIESQWNSLVCECNKNPFLFTCLVKPFISLNSANNWTPMIVTLSENTKLLGIVPLMVKRTYGLRLFSFILRPPYSPDFIVRDENEYMKAIVDYLFNSLGCHFLSLDFTGQSRFFENLKQECDKAGIHYSIISENGHRILPIRSTWQDFRKLKGGKFRRKFRKIEQNLNKIGEWKVVCANRKNTYTEVLSKILEVEKESWKQTWRAKKGSNIDDVLLAIWEGLSSKAQIQPDLDWTVWFLEIDNHPIAYALVVVYSGVAYIAKTSYAARYRRFYPGIYVVHVAIRELWNNGNVRLVDFLTDLKFMETWTDDVERRVRMVISKNPILPWFFTVLLRNNHIKRALSPVIGRVRISSIRKSSN